MTKFVTKTNKTEGINISINNYALTGRKCCCELVIFIFDKTFQNKFTFNEFYRNKHCCPNIL